MSKSLLRCAFCIPLEEIVETPGLCDRYVNPITCDYKYIKINYFVPEPGVYERCKSTEKCTLCGVSSGPHHIGCDYEKCPIDCNIHPDEWEWNLLPCGHGAGAEYFRAPSDTYGTYHGGLYHEDIGIEP